MASCQWMAGPRIYFTVNAVALLLLGSACSQVTSHSPGLTLPSAAEAGQAASGTADSTQYAAQPVSLNTTQAATGKPEAIAAPVADNRETLEDAWAAALSSDHRLGSTYLDAAAADDLLKRAESERLPTISLDGSYTVRDNEPSFVFDVAGLGLPSDTFPYMQREDFAFEVNAAIPIFTSGRLTHEIGAAESRQQAAALRAVTTEIDTRLNVARTYLAVLRAQRGVEVAETTTKSLAAQMQDVKMRFDHNMVSANDLLATEVTLTRARQELVQATHALDNARASLNRRMGRPLTTPVHISEMSFPPVDADLDRLTSEAVSRRPEPARLAAEAETLRQQSGAVLGASRPQVELHGGYAFQENRFQDPEGIASAGMRVSWNLFDSGRTRHEVNSLGHRAESASQLLAEQQSLIVLEVRKAWLNVQETRQRIVATQRAVDQSVENLRVAKARFSAGTATNSDVLTAETLRTRSWRDYYAAVYDSAYAVLVLRRASGTL
jgi:outer membrane protein